MNKVQSWFLGARTNVKRRWLIAGIFTIMAGAILEWYGYGIDSELSRYTYYWGSPYMRMQGFVVPQSVYDLREHYRFIGHIGIGLTMAGAAFIGVWEELTEKAKSLVKCTST